MYRPLKSAPCHTPYFPLLVRMVPSCYLTARQQSVSCAVEPPCLPFYYVNLVYGLSVARHVLVYIVINSTAKRQGMTERLFALGPGDVSIPEKNTNTRDGGYDKGAPVGCAAA